MALTNDAELAARMEMFRSHGITRDGARFVQPAPGAWYYEQQVLGFNYRMTDIQAALGSSQLARLDSYVERRNVLAQRYAELLSGLPLQLPTVLAGNRSSFHLYVVRVKSNARGATRTQVFSELRQSGMGVNVHYMPVHLQPYYQKLGFVPGAFPVAESYASEAITLPLYPELTEEGQNQVMSALARALT